MAHIDDPSVRAFLDAPNHAVISTHEPDGTIRSNIVWIEAVDGGVSVNSAVGRRWPTNLERDPRCTIVLLDEANLYHFVEIRGTAASTQDGADAQIDRLAKKYLGVDEYPYRSAEETRVSFTIRPDRVLVRDA
jgi:PPOX class probable F420-dependent enzyme